MVEGVLHVHQHKRDVQCLRWLAAAMPPSPCNHNMHGSRIHRDLGPHLGPGTRIGGKTTSDSGLKVERRQRWAGKMASNAKT